MRRLGGDAVYADRDRLCCRVASLLAGVPDLLDPIAAADVLDEVRRTIGNADPSASMRAAWKRAFVAKASAELAITGEGRRGA